MKIDMKINMKTNMTINKTNNAPNKLRVALIAALATTLATTLAVALCAAASESFAAGAGAAVSGSGHGGGHAGSGHGGRAAARSHGLRFAGWSQWGTGAAVYGVPPSPGIEPVASAGTFSEHVTYTYDVPWDAVHRYPRPLQPYAAAQGCHAEHVTVPRSSGGTQGVDIVRCY